MRHYASLSLSSEQTDKTAAERQLVGRLDRLTAGIDQDVQFTHVLTAVVDPDFAPPVDPDTPFVTPVVGHVLDVIADCSYAELEAEAVYRAFKRAWPARKTLLSATRRKKIPDRDKTRDKVYEKDGIALWLHLRSAPHMFGGHPPDDLERLPDDVLDDDDRAERNAKRARGTRRGL